MEESKRILKKYPDRIPIIVELATQTDLPPLDKYKYLVPMDITVGQFNYVIRKRIKLEQDKALFMFVNNSLPPTSAMISDVYSHNKNEDGFCYFIAAAESTFGFIHI